MAHVLGSDVSIRQVCPAELQRHQMNGTVVIFRQSTLGYVYFLNGAAAASA